MGKEINVVLSATSNAFTASLEKAEGALHHLTESASGIGESLKGKLESLPSLLSGGGLEAGIGAISGGVTGLAEHAIGALATMGPLGIGLGVVAAGAAVAAAAVAGLVLGIKSIAEPQMEMIDANLKVATSLGVPIDMLMTFHNVAKREAGLAAEEVDGAVRKMAKGLGEAASAGGPPKAALESLGLSVKTLTNQDLGTSFTQIADKIKDVGNKSEQVTIATQLFGKEGAKLLPLFLEGAEGIQAAHDKGLQFGTVLSTFDASKVAASQEVFEELGARVEGIKNKITVALAPVIEELGEKILALLPSADSFASFFTGAVKGVAYGVAYLIDGWTNLKISVLQAGSIIAEWAESGLRNVKDLAEGVVWLANKLGANWEVPQFLKDAPELAKAIKTQLGGEADALFISPTAVSQVTGVFDDIKKKNDESANAIIAKSKHTGDGMAEGFEEGAKKIKSTLDGITKELDFQKFLGGPEGLKLKTEGLKSEDIKKVFEVKDAGGNDAQVDQAAQQVTEIRKLTDAAKGTEAMDTLREKYTAIQGAVAKGLDPKFAEEIAKLHLNPQQADEFNRLSESIKKLDEASKAKEKLKDLGDEVAALKAGQSKDEFKLRQAGDSADADAIKGLESQKKVLEDVNKLLDASKSPAEKFTDEMSELNRRANEGTITWQQYDAAKKKALEEKAQAEKKDKDHNKSDEALKGEVHRFSFDIPANKNNAEQVASDHLNEAKLQSRYQLDIRTALQGGLFTVVSPG